MAISNFKPVSPDLNIQSDADTTLVKFGHLNALVDSINLTVVNSFVFPSYTTAQRTALDAVAGQAAFDTDLNKLYVYDGTAWQAAW